MWRKIIPFIGAALLLTFAGIKLTRNAEGNYKQEKILVSLRKIGHEILLQYGDSDSRILPVKKTDDHTYLIEFENAFSFAPEKLIKIVEQNVQAAQLPEKYLVEVIDRKNETVNYSYEMSSRGDTAKIACIGRNPPKGNYFVKIHFEPNATQTSSIAVIFPYLFLSLAIVLLFRGFKGYQKKSVHASAVQTKIEDESEIPIGDFAFSTKTMILRKGSERIELSAKEAKILGIFASHCNEIVNRDDLLKEVWENEGVFVGRSLDVFVSKLRKKLQPDVRIRIVNIHGKGYKLEVQENNLVSN